MAIEEGFDENQPFSNNTENVVEYLAFSSRKSKILSNMNQYQSLPEFIEICKKDGTSHAGISFV